MSAPILVDDPPTDDPVEHTGRRSAWDEVRERQRRDRERLDAEHDAATSDGAGPCSLCGLRVPGGRDAVGRCRFCVPNDRPQPRPDRPVAAATSVRHAQPPGAAALCRGCGTRLIACYRDQQFHPSCDPAPPGWTAEQLARWCP